MTQANHSTKRRTAMTLVEVLIVIALLSIIASVAFTYYLGNLEDSKVSMARYNLNRLRSIIQLYAAHHNKVPTAKLAELIATTDQSGNIGTDQQHRFGPYLTHIPTNPLTGSNSVTAVPSSPATLADVTGQSGWLYDAASGKIWIDHVKYFVE